VSISSPLFLSLRAPLYAHSSTSLTLPPLDAPKALSFVAQSKREDSRRFFSSLFLLSTISEIYFRPDAPSLCFFDNEAGDRDVHSADTDAPTREGRGRGQHAVSS
jgi:hypothetical protein